MSYSSAGRRSVGKTNKTLVTLLTRLRYPTRFAYYAANNFAYRSSFTSDKESLVALSNEEDIEDEGDGDKEDKGNEGDKGDKEDEDDKDDEGDKGDDSEEDDGDKGNGEEDDDDEGDSDESDLNFAYYAAKYEESLVALVRK
ncbi:hypothetical protein QBC39DRAFT_335353 [Podospora conica]|nr:hypothetical protein QBC39DRAFT_335353 [Schizothecium conicum]